MKIGLLPVVAALFGMGAIALYPDWVSGQAANPQVSPVNPAVADCNKNSLNDLNKGAGVLITSVLLCAPNNIPPFTLEGLQHDFDFYSWETFVALNWPADGKTAIGGGSRSGGDAQSRWEDGNNFRQLPDVMLEDGQKPTWGVRIVPPECRTMDGPGKMIVHVIEEAFDQPFRSGPLIDQNGNYALFDILINKPMFDYIVFNHLYSRQGQEQFFNPQDNGTTDAPSASPGAPTKPPLAIVNFPKGTQTGETGNGAPGTMGALMLKVSWKVMGNGDDPAKFHTVDALVYSPATPGKPATCVEKTLGMVGFHAAHKTAKDPQWLWTTFEHVANAPEEADVKNNRVASNSRFNFYNPQCPPAQCLANELPPQPWNPRVEPFPNGFKSQVVRLFQLQDDAVALNSLFHGLDGIKGAVWENYMLISTQWPTNATDTVNPTGTPAPTFLANTTLETYSQGEMPLSSSSCIGCHNNATTLHAPAGASDFTFTLEKAQKAQ